MRGRMAQPWRTPPNFATERFEPLAGYRHEFGHGLHIPIGFADVDVADVGGERHHGIAKVAALFLPEHQSATDERMSEIMDAD